MAIEERATLAHWNYLLALEQDVNELSRFVEIDRRNFSCFSLEIARILLAAGAEVDVVCKQVCQQLRPGTLASTISSYKPIITDDFPTFAKFEVLIPRFGLSLHPWSEWSRAEGNPNWWMAYNKVKHHRHSDYDLANIKNALNAVAGLFVAVLHFYPSEARAGKLLPPTTLFRIADRFSTGDTYDGYEFGRNYIIEQAERNPGSEPHSPST